MDANKTPSNKIFIATIVSLIFMILAASLPVEAETITIDRKTLLAVPQSVQNSKGNPIAIFKSGQIKTSDGKYPIGRADLEFTLKASSEISVVVDGKTVVPGNTVTIKEWNFSKHNNGYEIEIYPLEPGSNGEISYSITAPSAYVSDDPNAKIPEKTVLFEFIAGQASIAHSIAYPWSNSNGSINYVGLGISDTHSFGTLNSFKYLNDQGQWLALSQSDPIFPYANQYIKDDKTIVNLGSFPFGLHFSSNSMYYSPDQHEFKSTFKPFKVEVSVNGGAYQELSVNAGGYTDQVPAFKNGDIVSVSIWTSEDPAIEQRQLSFDTLYLIPFTGTKVITDFTDIDEPVAALDYLEYSEVDVSSFVSQLNEISYPNLTTIQKTSQGDLVLSSRNHPIALIDTETLKIKKYPNYSIFVTPGGCLSAQIDLYSYSRDTLFSLALYEEDWDGSLHTKLPEDGETDYTNDSFNPNVTMTFDPSSFLASIDSNLESLDLQDPELIRRQLIDFINTEAEKVKPLPISDVTTQANGIEILQVSEGKKSMVSRYAGLVAVKRCKDANSKELRPSEGVPLKFNAVFKNFLSQ